MGLLSFSRSQGALEYLMNYGWAIIVVMIVGGSMWQMGIISLSHDKVVVEGFEDIKTISHT